MDPTFSQLSTRKIGDCLVALIAVLPKLNELGRVAHLSQQEVVNLPNWLEIFLSAAPLVVLGFDRRAVWDVAAHP